MANIEKRQIIDSRNLSGEFYFASIFQQAYARGILCDSDIENIQLQCIRLLAYKSERYTRGESSSIRVEAAEKIMKSNLYTIGLYLKTLPCAGSAVGELKTATIFEMYQKGRKLINVKLHTAKHFYELAKKNKVKSSNYTYNATLSDNGIGVFFKSYNPDFEAHESPASIDYQLCNPVTDLAGVEFIQKYVESLFLENEFCKHFAGEDIHYLLCGYDEGYKDLLINIFEQVLTVALGCSLANRSVVKLDISEDEARRLHHELSKDAGCSLALTIGKATGKMLEDLDVANLSLRRYIEKSLPQITSNIARAVKMNTLGKVFVSPAYPESKPKIEFLSGVKMDDEDYRKLIDELLLCRYSSDKLALIKEKVKSFDDFEDVLFDAQLSEGEIILALGILGEFEIAALIKRHSYKLCIQAVDLSESEQTLRLCLKNYIDQLPADKQKQISGIAIQLRT